MGFGESVEERIFLPLQGAACPANWRASSMEGLSKLWDTVFDFKHSSSHTACRAGMTDSEGFHLC